MSTLTISSWPSQPPDRQTQGYVIPSPYTRHGVPPLWVSGHAFHREGCTARRITSPGRLVQEVETGWKKLWKKLLTDYA